MSEILCRKIYRHCGHKYSHIHGHSGHKFLHIPGHSCHKFLHIYGHSGHKFLHIYGHCSHKFLHIYEHSGTVHWRHNLTNEKNTRFNENNKKYAKKNTWIFILKNAYRFILSKIIKALNILFLLKRQRYNAKDHAQYLFVYPYYTYWW